MSHHKDIIIDGVKIGHVRITNSGQVLSVWINQPWGDGELLCSIYPEVFQDGEEE
jgi:hypothetical protein